MSADGSTTIESSAIGVRHVRLTRILSWLGFVGLFVALVAAVLLMDHLMKVHSALIFATYLLWLLPWTASYAIWFLEPKRRGRVVVQHDGALRIERGGATRVVPRTKIQSVQSVVRADKRAPSQSRTSAEIVLTNGDVFSVDVPSVPDADAIVGRLGFGAGQRRQHFELAARKRRFLHLGLAFLAYQATSIAAIPLFMVAMVSFGPLVSLFPVLMAIDGMALPFVYRFFRRKAAAPVLEIGDDGFVLTSGNRPPRFIGRSTFYGAQLVPGSGHITINTQEGPIAVTGMWLDEAMARAALHALHSRWSATPATPGPRVAAFARSGRPLEAWRADLLARVSGAGYRGDGLTSEEAEIVVRTPSAPADARIGAALVLAAAGERVRVAAAAEPVADQHLRVALEAVARGGEDAELLDAATTSERTQRGR